MHRKSFLQHLLVALTMSSLAYGMKEDLNKQLLRAAQNGNLAQVKELLENELIDVNCIDTSNIYDHTSLSYACVTGHFGIVKLLVERNANINYISPKGYFPLYWACIRGHLPIVKLLLSKGAQIYQDSCTDPLLFLSSNQYYYDIIKTFLDYGANPNIINAQHGTTPLIIAALTGDLKIVQLLLDNNADTNIKSNQGKTARAYALGEGHKSIATAIDRAENKRTIQLLVSQQLLAPHIQHPIQFLLAIQRT
jgi:ankyrin repeat protein